MDVAVSEMDGYRLPPLKSNPPTRDVPASHTETTDETHCFDVRAVDYIHKPFSPTVVAARARPTPHYARHMSNWTADSRPSRRTRHRAEDPVVYSPQRRPPRRGLDIAGASPVRERKSRDHLQTPDAPVAIPLLTLFALGYFIYDRMARIEDQSRLSNLQVKSLATLGNIEQSFSEARVGIRTFLLAEQPAERTKAEAAEKAGQVELGRLLARYVDTLSPATKTAA